MLMPSPLHGKLSVKRGLVILLFINGYGNSHLEKLGKHGEWSYCGGIWWFHGAVSCAIINFIGWKIMLFALE